MRNWIPAVLIVVVLAMLAAACSSSSASEETTVPTTAITESSPDPADVAEATQKAFADTFLTQDIDALAALLADDYEFFDPTTGAYTNGAKVAISHMQDIYDWTDPEQTELVERFVSVDGTAGTVVYHWVATTALGSDIDIIMTQVHEYDTDGKVRKVTNYYGGRGAYDQIMGSGS